MSTPPLNDGRTRRGTADVYLTTGERVSLTYEMWETSGGLRDAMERAAVWHMVHGTDGHLVIRLDQIAAVVAIKPPEP